MTVKTRIVQRSPDLGLGIKLQRLSEPPKPQKPADPLPPPPPVVEPSPPWWWGWFGEDGERRTRLETTHSNGDPAMDGRLGYWPGVWTATVDGASAVTWIVEFTPMLWLGQWDEPTNEVVSVVVAWEGKPTRWDLPPVTPLPLPEDLFALAPFDLPDPVSYLGEDFTPVTYWSGPVTALPLAIAAGNTLCVVQDSRGVSGALRASAFFNGTALGEVTCLFKRINIVSLGGGST